MTQTEKPLTEKESLDLIAMMITKAKESYYDTGLSAMMWGIVIAVCALVRLSELQFDYHLPVDIYWLTVVAVIPQIFISIKEKKMRRVKTYDDVYMDYVWLAFGISIVLLILITNAIFNAGETVQGSYQVVAVKHTTLRFYEYISPLFLLLYGIPTFITGAACRFQPMLWGGLLCWVCCVIAIYTNVKIDLILTAFSAIVAWFIPGIIMQKEYRKAVRELAKTDV